MAIINSKFKKKKERRNLKINLLRPLADVWLLVSDSYLKQRNLIYFFKAGNLFFWATKHLT